MSTGGCFSAGLFPTVCRKETLGPLRAEKKLASFRKQRNEILNASFSSEKKLKKRGTSTKNSTKAESIIKARVFGTRQRMF